MYADIWSKFIHIFILFLILRLNLFLFFCRFISFHYHPFFFHLLFIPIFFIFIILHFHLRLFFLLLFITIIFLRLCKISQHVH